MVSETAGLAEVQGCQQMVGCGEGGSMTKAVPGKVKRVDKENNYVMLLKY